MTKLVSSLIVIAIGLGCSQQTSTTQEQPKPTTKEQPTPTPPAADVSRSRAGPDYQTLWCRGGGRSSATTAVTLRAFRTGGVIVTEFEFAKSGKPAGADGSALTPGTCAFEDHVVEPDPIKLTYAEEGEAQLR